MAIIENTKGLKEWRGFYDFAVDGGAISTITLRSDRGPIPNGALIVSGVLDIDTACASATGTMAIQSEAAADILAATAQAGLTTGRKDVIPDGTGSTAVELTAARNPALVIATAAFTAGKFTLSLFWR